MYNVSMMPSYSTHPRYKSTAEPSSIETRKHGGLHTTGATPLGISLASRPESGERFRLIVYIVWPRPRNVRHYKSSAYPSHIETGKHSGLHRNRRHSPGKGARTTVYSFSLSSKGAPPLHHIRLANVWLPCLLTIVL